MAESRGRRRGRGSAGTTPRRLVWLGLALLAALWSPITPASPLRIGLTPVFLDDQVALLRDWQAYMAERLSRPVEFIQRQTYREITDLLLQGQIDAAWLCGYPFVRHRDQLVVVVVPLYQRQSLYQSYLIVPATDHQTASITDLEGGIFAFSDPDSNSGYLYPVFEMRQRGFRPNEFFRRTFFTWGHRGVIQAVADGLADAGAVDGYVWETMLKQSPDLVRKTRVFGRSRPFGFPPFVARQDSGPGIMKFGRLLLEMNQDPPGREILGRLNLDGFERADPVIYEPIREMMQFIEDASTHVVQ